MDKNTKNLNDLELITNKNSSYGQSEIRAMQEKFIVTYSNQKGWNSNNLTTEQLLEITQHKDFKNPLMMKS